MPELWSKLCSSIWYDGPWDSMQTCDPGHVYLGQLRTCICGFHWDKVSYFGQAVHTTTQIESYPHRVLGSPVIKSMSSLSHFHSGIGIGSSNPGGFWCSAFTLWHTSHTTTYSAISFFIPVHQKRSFKSTYILVFLGCIEYGESWASWSINFLISALLGTNTRSSNHKVSCSSSRKPLAFYSLIFSFISAISLSSF